MSIILNIETATSPGSVALHQDGQLIALNELHKKKSHAAKIPVLIDNILSTTGFCFKDLDAVAVSGGPGSYTGLRIGSGLAKGIAFANDIPLIQVETLKIVAEAVRNSNQGIWYAPMIDARRMEVYTCLLDSNFDYILDTQAMILDTDSFQIYLKDHQIIFCGDGSEKARGMINNRRALFADNIYPSAGNMGKFAQQKFNSSDFCNLDEWEPFYLKDFIAGKPKPITSY